MWGKECEVVKEGAREDSNIQAQLCIYFVELHTNRAHMTACIEEGLYKLLSRTHTMYTYYNRHIQIRSTPDL